MKTIVYALISAVMLVAGASAQSVSVGSASTSCGSSVSVPVSIGSVTGMLALQFEVTYNSSALTLTAVDRGSLTNSFLVDHSASNGTVRVIMASGSGVSGPGEVAVLKFTAASSASGNYPLNISAVEVNDQPKSGSVGAVTVSCSSGGGPQPPPSSGQTVTIGTASANCGSSVEVPVSVSSVSSLLALDFRVAFDSSALTFSGATSSSGSFLIETNETSPGSLRVIMASGSPVAANGTVATLKFNVGASANGTLPLTISNVSVNDASVTGASGAVTATCGGQPPNPPGPPATPTYTSPVHESTGVAAPVTLRWNGVAGASTYRVRFGTTNPPPFHNATDRTNLNVATQQGTLYYWQIEAIATGGSTLGPVWQFTTLGTNCTVPAAPQLYGPTTDVSSGAAFSVTWSMISGATEYVLEESNDATFANPAISTHSTPSATMTLWFSNPTTRYFRVRGRNAAAACSTDGARSNSVAVRIVPGNSVAAAPRFLAVAGSLAGSAGSYFRTSLQLHNHSNGMMRGRVVFHRQGASGSSSDPSFNYTLAPGETTSWKDVVLAFGVGSGIGSIDLLSIEGDSPLTVARIYNDAGANGTTGVAIDAMASGDALKGGQRGQLLGPIDPVRARMNIGVRTLGDGATIDFMLRDYSGIVKQVARRSFGPTWFEQMSLGALFDKVLTGDEVVVVEVVTGSAIVYGSITDNVTQDPTIQFARAR